METCMVICLALIICLLLLRKAAITKAGKKDRLPDSYLPEIMGRTKTLKSPLKPKAAGEGQKQKPPSVGHSFAHGTGDNGVIPVIPQEAPEDVFSREPDLEEEEEEWNGYGAPMGEDGFATGVTFEELSFVGNLLQQEQPEPAGQQQAAAIVHKIVGTGLFSLLENSMESAAGKIALLLDRNMDLSDAGASTMRNKGWNDFDIGDFV